MRLATLQTPQGPRAVVRSGDCYIDINATDSSLPNSIREWLAQNLLSQVAAVAAKPGTGGGTFTNPGGTQGQGAPA